MRAQRAISVIACAVSLAVLVHCGVGDNSNPKGAAGAGGTDGGRGGTSGASGSTAGNAGSSAAGAGNLDASGGKGGAGGNGGSSGRGGTSGNGGSAIGGRGGGSLDAGGASGAGGSTAGNAGSSAAGAGNLDAGDGKGGASGNGGGSGRGGTGGNGGSAIDGSADSTGRDSGTGIWHPPPGTTWQWQLTGTIDTSVDAEMYDIDLFDTPQGTIDALHAAGRIVICYLSAGTYEPGRPDSSSIPQAARGNGVQGWPGEEWLDTRDATVRQIMTARMDLAAQKKCDGVEPDNVDGYQNNPGFPLTSSTQLDYNEFLATEAHSRGLSVGLKNSLDAYRLVCP
jgi:hypothetical protein